MFFLEKKEPKNFFPFGSVQTSTFRTKQTEVFLLLFLQKKKVSPTLGCLGDQAVTASQVGAFLPSLRTVSGIRVANRPKPIAAAIARANQAAS